MPQVPLYCDCSCGQKMGYDYGHKVVIKSKHHGKDHFLTIPKFIDAKEFQDEIMERVAGSSN